MRHLLLALFFSGLLLHPSISSAATPKPAFFDSAMGSQEGMNALTDAQYVELRAYLSAAAIEAPDTVLQIDAVSVSLDKTTYIKNDPVTIALAVLSETAQGYADTHTDAKDAPALTVKLGLTDQSGSPCIDPIEKTFSLTNLNPTFTTAAIANCESPKASVSLTDWNKKDLGMWEIRSVGNIPVPAGLPEASASVPAAPSNEVVPTDESQTVSDTSNLMNVKTGVIVFVVVLFLYAIGAILWKGKRGIRILIPVLLFGFIFANETHAEEFPGRQALPDGLSYCDDFISYGSLQAHFANSDLGTIENRKITAAILIENVDDVPVGDIDIYATVFRDRPGNEDSYSADPVAMVAVAEDLLFFANESRVLPFEWQIPDGVEEGAYRISLSVAAHGRFDMFGMPITRYDSGSGSVFDLSGNTGKGLTFDRMSVTVDGKPYDFGAGVLKLEPETHASTVSVSVENGPSGDTVKGKLVWELYGEAEAAPYALLHTAERDIKLLPGQHTKLSYYMDAEDRSDYLLLGRLSTETDHESVIVIRINRFPEGIIDVSRGAFSYAGVSEYPNTSGQAVAYACLNPKNLGNRKDVAVGIAVMESGGRTASFRGRLHP